MKPTAYGIGIKGNELPSQVKGKMVKEYAIWKEMLRRVADKKAYRNFLDIVNAQYMKGGCITQTFIMILKIFQVMMNGTTIQKNANIILIKILEFLTQRFILLTPVCLLQLQRIH
ncbi:hypothetical protein [Enterobacter asburiae]|uniref:hypothetical protein n=1 Tax=Enterobacter asburiae TaxID=61645 RepID=UPI0011D1ECA8|nr:hypothetical protein [Enterobacter asburiae]